MTKLYLRVVNFRLNALRATPRSSRDLLETSRTLLMPGILRAAECNESIDLCFCTDDMPGNHWNSTYLVATRARPSKRGMKIGLSAMDYPIVTSAHIRETKTYFYSRLHSFYGCPD